MIFIKELFLFILYLIVFIIFHLSLERIIIWKKIVIKYEKQASDFALGISMGIISLLMQIFNEKILPEFSITLFIVSSLMLTFFKNFNVGLYSIIAPLIFMIVVKDISYLTYMMIVIFFVSMVTIIIFTNTLKNITSFIAWYFLSLSMTLICYLIASIVFENKFSLSIFKTIVLPYVLMFISFFGISYSTKIVASSRNLYESSNFVFGKYYRPSLAFDAIGKIIHKEKINYGAFVIFDINFIKDSNQSDIEIEETILEKIESQLPDNVIQFDASGGRYGFFMKADNQIKNKNYLESIFNSLPNRLKTMSRKIVKVNVKAAVSFYGKDSGSLNQLSDYSNFSLNYSNQSFATFNYSIYKKWVQDNWLLFLMDKKLQLDNFANSYNTILDIKSLEQLGIINEVINISEFSFVESINDIFEISGWKNQFNRYFALDAIKANIGRLIFVEYSPTILENNFNLDLFILSVKKQTALKNLGLIFREEEFKKVKNHKLVELNIKKLADEGIIIIFDDQERANNISNSYIISKLSSNKRILFPNRTILENIDTEQDLIHACSKKVRFFTGKVIPKQISFFKLDKQSKMYLESIIKRKGQ